MKLGFLTGCLSAMPLEKIAAFAAARGFKALEVSAWPVVNTRDYSGSNIDVAGMNGTKAAEIKDLFSRHGLEISSLAYYDNLLHQDQKIRQTYLAHLYKVIDAAALLGVELVGTFAGRDLTKTIGENMDQFERVFKEILTYAESKHVKIMIENCPMPGWQPDGWAGTVSYSPELWREMFRRVPNRSFGLNFDPSHLYWLGIDYVRAVGDFRERIFHAHAKDTVIYKDKLYEYGIFGKQINRNGVWDTGWWSYRMPGRGEIDWAKFIGALKDAGYQGVLSIEHEDPDYEGSEEKVKEGLGLGYEYLAGLI
ncbi:MAG: sugar phosphate isomerase/epimerase family protein [Bacteroidota bacterium]